MVDRAINFLINLDEALPARSKAMVLNEMTMALIECISLYSKMLGKLGKIKKIAMAFWPVKLIPLNETRACVCSYLLNAQEKLYVGKFNQTLPKPDNVIKGADPFSFLDALRSYNNSYLRRTKNFKRGYLVQEALFNTNEIGYFKNFFLNQYNTDAFGDPYFILEGDPIAKSVNQVKIIQDVYDYVGLKDVKMLDDYANIITELCDAWIQKGGKDLDKLKATTVDTKTEDKNLEMLNKELQTEKERDLQNEPEQLLKSGKYKISDKSGEFFNELNALKNVVERLKSAADQRDLFLLEEGLKDMDLKYYELGNSISRYRSEIDQLKKSLDREKYDTDKIHSQKITELERKIVEVQRQVDSKHGVLNKDLTSAEAAIVQIKQEKQSCLDNIEAIKDSELTDVQKFFNDYTIEIKTQNVVVGIPVFIFFFVDPTSNKTTKRVPVLPMLIERGDIVRTKITESFRSKLEDLMNKLNPMINLVETEGENCNLMNVTKNLDSRLEEAINDLRVRKILSKKIAERAKDIISNLVW